jgi:hypothetical protein
MSDGGTFVQRKLGGRGQPAVERTDDQNLHGPIPSSARFIPRNKAVPGQDLPAGWLASD